MPIVTRCSAPGCETLTVGRYCVLHEARLPRVFVRGRPYVAFLEPTPPALTSEGLFAGVTTPPAPRESTLLRP